MSLFDKKITLAPEQRAIVEGIATELKIPEAEVLWVLVELGSTLSVWSQQDEKVWDLINKTGGTNVEYKNWDKIAKSLFAAFNRGWGRT